MATSLTIDTLPTSPSSIASNGFSKRMLDEGSCEMSVKKEITFNSKNMREIKFRAWDKKERKMFRHSIDGDGVLDEWYSDDWGIFYGALKSIQKSCVLMQYTGLKDKNGKEIYEGDIMRDEYGRLATIVYDHECGVLGGFTYLSDDDGFGYSIESIGNIYENPELLKK